AYVSDVGMVGAADSVIGMRTREALQRFLSPVPARLQVENDGPLVFNSVLIETDDSTGRALSIARVDRRLED
ncbi:MAG: YmdB family metallophosphoesterase, partial [Chloroflexi bacterium]|nr:YmdB family metallophosphoesterase [Chloroflexota bacterium]